MNYILNYILDGHEPRPCGSAEEWARWYESNDRRVRLSTVSGSRISTVFLGIDHRVGGEGPPILFETMVFGGPLDGSQERCCTWWEAEAQHQDMERRVREATS